MKITNRFFVAVFLVTFSMPSLSEYRLYGAGGRSCGEWVSERSSGSWYHKGQWMLGVISAVGYYHVHKLKVTDSDALAVWMDNYCQKNPLVPFSDGVYELVTELSKKKP